jgi:hypothetical protein
MRRSAIVRRRRNLAPVDFEQIFLVQVFLVHCLCLNTLFRHCEERLVRRSSQSEGGSDEAIQLGDPKESWIASLHSQ